MNHRILLFLFYIGIDYFSCQFEVISLVLKLKKKKRKKKGFSCGSHGFMALSSRGIECITSIYLFVYVL